MSLNLDTSPSPLGRSFALKDGDLIYDNVAGSLATVAGLDALIQALTLAIETQLESDVLNVTFGFDQLSVGSFSSGLATSKEYVKMQLVRCVSADRRVKDVREIYFKDDPRYFEVIGLNDADAKHALVRQIRAARAYTVYVVIEVVTGQQVTLQAEAPVG